MSLLRLDSNKVYQACIRAMASYTLQLEQDREYLVQKRMKGFFGLFKKTREQAIICLENGGFNDYNCIGIHCMTPWITNRVGKMAKESKDGYVYLDNDEWDTISKYYTGETNVL